MTSSDYSNRPAVLRCGRCGRIADWTDARLQVVCDCRPRLELPPPLVREAESADRDRAIEILHREFRGRQLVADGEPISVDAAEHALKRRAATSTRAPPSPGGSLWARRRLRRTATVLSARGRLSSPRSPCR